MSFKFIFHRMKSNRRFQAFSKYDSDVSLLNFKKYKYTAEY